MVLQVFWHATKEEHELSKLFHLKYFLWILKKTTDSVVFSIAVSFENALVACLVLEFSEEW